MSSRSSRRAFLGFGLFALLGGAAGLWWLRREAGGVLAPACLEELLLPDPSHAFYVGRWYLNAVPAEASVEALSERVFGARRFRRRDECVAYLRERIQSDYAERRVGRLNGFLVSRTELRLYALLSLLASENARSRLRSGVTAGYRCYV